jgi:predicted RNase H-like HicB family nuclease/DNA-binding XRE family transcriptional regulator
MKYHFKVHKEGKGFWAQCMELEGCITQGRSLEELYKNMEEALNLYIQESEDSEDLAAFPNDSIKKSKTVVEVPVEPEIAFAFLVRYCRITYGMTQKEAAKKMGFDTIYSYQRLEGRRCNPSLKTLSKIKQLFPDFSVDLVLSH